VHGIGDRIKSIADGLDVRQASRREFPAATLTRITF
jgi:hypothetical protein